MALITCKDCQKEFSTDAKSCPHCGAKKPYGVQKTIIDVLSIFFVSWVFFSYLASQNGSKADLCSDNKQAYEVVSSFAKDGNSNFVMSDMAEAKFEHLSGCMIRVTSYGMKNGERDDFSLIVSPWTPEGQTKQIFRINLTETLKGVEE